MAVTAYIALGSNLGARPQHLDQALEELRKTHQEQDGLSTLAIRQYRNLFNTAWTAVLAFELAKKRS